MTLSAPAPFPWKRKRRRKVYSSWYLEQRGGARSVKVHSQDEEDEEDRYRNCIGL
jgi:hypothetical protein